MRSGPIRPEPRGGWARALACGVMVGVVSWACAQTGRTPVYPDDAPVAGESLARVVELARSGNQAEAVRALQALLDGRADRVLATDDDPDLFVTVRSRAHAALLGDPELLEWYRRIEGPRADRMLEQGRVGEVERTRQLTPAGFGATLRLAERELHASAFESARMRLESLLGHPDLSGERASDASRLAWRVWAALPRDSVGRSASRLGEGRGAAGLGVDSGRPAGIDALQWPVGARERVSTPWTAAPGLDVSQVVSSPLHTRELVPAHELGAMRRLGRGPSSRAQPGWMMPAVVGDVVYVNDGARVGAWDRFTLEPIWRVKPVPPAGLDARVAQLGARIGADGQAPGTVAVGPGVVVAVTGRPLREDTSEPVVLHGLDRRTGSVRWSWHPGLHDASMAGGEIDEPVLIDGDTAVVFVVVRGQSRRLWSEVAFGLDVWDGSVRWVRPIGSAGTLPYASDTPLSRGAAAHNGVVYRVSASGLVAAVEAHLGRVRWVRRTSGTSPIGRRDTDLGPAGAWASAAPIVERGRVIFATPDGERVMAIETSSGRELGARSGDGLGTPRYLLRVGDRLIAVGSGGVMAVPLGSFPSGDARTVWAGSGTPVVGRVVVAGGRLLIPTSSGLEVAHIAGDRGSAMGVELDASGQLVPVEGQLLVADETSVHSYLVWDVAERVLVERMERSPDDPEPALTFLELAYQSGRSERVVEAAERALASIGRADPGAQETARARARLFDALARIVDQGRRPGVRGVWEGLAPDLLGLLERVAVSSRQRLVHRLALGVEFERTDPIRAMEIYGRIVEQSELGSAQWSGGAFPISGRAEAARRLRDLSHGLDTEQVLAVGREASDRASMLGESAAAGSYETLALRYPVAGVTPMLWLRAGDAHDGAADRSRAMRAWGSGLKAASMLPREARDGRFSETVTALTTRQAAVLREQGRLEELAMLLERVDRTVGDVDLVGGPEGRARLRERLDGWRSERVRLARIGPELGREVQTVGPGRLLEAVLDRSGDAGYAGYALLASAGDVPGTEVVSAIETGQTGAGVVAERWRTEIPGRAVVLEADRRWVDLVALGEGAGRLLRLDAQTGERAWETESVAAMLYGSISEAARSHAGHRAIVRTPPDGRISAGDLVVGSGSGVVVVADRVGRIAGVERRTGKRLWSSSTSIGRVHDLAVSGGVVSLAGMDAWDPGQGERMVLVTLDVRTGRELASFSLDGSGDVRGRAGGGPSGEIQSDGPRWIRPGPDGTMLLGLDRGVMRIDPVEGGALWAVEGQGLGSSLDAWVRGGSLIVLDAERRIRIGAAMDGSGLDGLEPGLESFAQVSEIVAHSVDAWGESRVVLAGDAGMVVVDGMGRVVGADAIGARGASGGGASLGVAGVGVGESRAVIVVAGRGDEGASARVHMVDRTGRLIADPIEVRWAREGSGASGVSLLDGVVLIETGGAVVAMRAPAIDSGV